MEKSELTFSRCVGILNILINKLKLEGMRLGERRASRQRVPEPFQPIVWRAYLTGSARGEA